MSYTIEKLILFIAFFVSLSLVGVIVTLYSDVKSLEAEIQKNKISDLKTKWLETGITCKQQHEIDTLEIALGNESIDLPLKLERDQNYELCVEIVDAYAILAYRTYGEVFDQIIIDRWIEQQVK